MGAYEPLQHDEKKKFCVYLRNYFINKIDIRDGWKYGEGNLLFRFDYIFGLKPENRKAISRQRQIVVS